MTAVTTSGATPLRADRPRWELGEYPGPTARHAYLGLTVVVTVVVYYLVSAGSSVAVLQMADLHISFHYLLWTAAAGNLIGAGGAWLAGLTDRIGRVVVVVTGLGSAGLLTLVALPLSPDRWVFSGLTLVVGTIEGVTLVATPALMRDFSPQSSRGGAMGLWTLGPVIGALVASAVGTITIQGTPAAAFWGHEYVIAGWTGLAGAAVAAIWLRELSPALREQVLVTEADSLLVDAHPTGAGSAPAEHPWRQMLTADVIVSGFSVSLLLVAFYTAIAVGVIAFQAAFGFSLHQANALGDWMWAANAVAVVGIGVASDRLGVRKPFMVVGAVVTAAAIVEYQGLFGHTPSFDKVAVVSAVMAFGLGIAFTPWLASFTETVEARNPALTATGLAVWGLTLRVVICVALGLLPAVVGSMTPLVDFVVRTSPHVADLEWAGAHASLLAEVEQPAAEAELQALASLQRQHPAQLAGIEAHSGAFTTLATYQPEVSAVAADPTLFTQLAADPFDATLGSRAVTALGGGDLGTARYDTLIAHSAQIVPALTYARAHPDQVAVAEADSALLQWAGAHAALVEDASANAGRLERLASLPKPVAAYANTHGVAVEAAERQLPGQLRDWYWICFAGVAMFGCSVPLLRGRWSPRRARADRLGARHRALRRGGLSGLASTAEPPPQPGDASDPQSAKGQRRHRP